MQLQRVGQRIVLVEQRLADLGNPLVGIGIEVAVDGLSRPERDVVQIDDVVVGAAIDERTNLAVAYGQRLLEEVGGTVVPQSHGRLALCIGCQGSKTGCKEQIFPHICSF